MNRRIKKKLKKKAFESMLKFGPYPHMLIPAAKTYREIKLKRRRIHESVVWMRHVTFQYKGYNAQLKDCRRLRREYAKAFDEKLKRNMSCTNWGINTSGKPICIDYPVEE